MATLDVIVHAIAITSQHTRGYELRPVAGDALPAFAAGAHIDVHIRPGLVRQYSLCNAPDETHRYQLCVKHEATGRGGSATMHATVHVGDRLRISPPRNTFAVAPGATRHVLVGAGVGITPLLAMAHAHHAAGADFALHHYATAPAHTPLGEHVAAQDFAERVRFHHSAAGDGLRAGPPRDLTSPAASDALYLCGPPGFMELARQLAVRAGWAPEQIHAEHFAATADTRPRADDGSFLVHLAASGRSVTVGADQTIAEALLEHGVEVELSCEQGICGACLTPVLAGLPEHRDEVQTAVEHAANTQMTICCSRARTAELILDL